MAANDSDTLKIPGEAVSAFLLQCGALTVLCVANALMPTRMFLGHHSPDMVALLRSHPVYTIADLLLNAWHLFTLILDVVLWRISIREIPVLFAYKHGIPLEVTDETADGRNMTRVEIKEPGAPAWSSDEDPNESEDARIVRRVRLGNRRPRPLPHSLEKEMPIHAFGEIPHLGRRYAACALATAYMLQLAGLRRFDWRDAPALAMCASIAFSELCNHLRPAAEPLEKRSRAILRRLCADKSLDDATGAVLVLLFLEFCVFLGVTNNAQGCGLALFALEIPFLWLPGVAGMHTYREADASGAVGPTTLTLVVVKTVVVVFSWSLLYTGQAWQQADMARVLKACSWCLLLSPGSYVLGEILAAVSKLWGSARGRPAAVASIAVHGQ